MNPFLTTLQNDMRVQWRSQLYIIGIVAALITGGVLTLVTSEQNLFRAFPTAIILIVGGSTLLYVAGMILFEKDEGTLNALVVSPLKPTQYLLSKLVSLTLLATLEALVMLTMTYVFLGTLPTVSGLFFFVVGTVLTGVIYTLVGMILIVRYQQLTDFLVPVLGIAIFLQLPVGYFLGVIEHWGLLLIPTSAPALLIRGGFHTIPMGHWLFALLYPLVIIALLGAWAHKAFHTHIIEKAG